MALIKEQTANGFAGLPALRQLGLMIGLAGSVALGVAVVLWTQEPGYSLLYGNLSGNDASQVLDALQKSNIMYKVDESSGAVMVPTSKVHDARLKLAGSGLPKGNGVGFELFEKEQDLGTSQFVEQARYQYALEVELSRSIMTIRDVKNVRVHLAIPKRTAFVRKKEKPRASVVLELFGGRNLDDGQVASVVHLVASAVNGMSPENVTVVDQTGNLLSKGMRDKGMAMSSSQFEYTRRLEQIYNKRIEDLISPIVGPGRVRAQVVADIDFTMSEKTFESFNPDLPALRSEQLDEQSSASGNGTGGVSGALSTQPPTGGGANGAAGRQASGGANGSNSRRTTRNYELDKTISHTRKSAGDIRKISVAVLVDDLQTVDEDGVVTKTPLDEAAITRITSLVKESVGFDARRGDSINVINASFHVPAPPEPLPEVPITEQQWVWDLGKQVLGGIVVLILVFGVLKPVMRSLAEKGDGLPVYPDQMSPDQLSLQGGGVPGGQLAAPVEDNLTAAKNLAAQDPARVAQVVKTWVETDQ